MIGKKCQLAERKKSSILVSEIKHTKSNNNNNKIETTNWRTCEPYIDLPASRDVTMRNRIVQDVSHRGSELSGKSNTSRWGAICLLPVMPYNS